ncbi:MAG: SCO family protein [Phycisphaerales bacterium]|nr:SCO family protein [Phycisphaerales bacterium]
MPLAARVNAGRMGMVLAMMPALASPLAPAQVNQRPAFLDEVGLEEHLGARVPLELTFQDSQGRTVPLAASFAGGRPVVLALVYYRCPVVCTMVMEQMVASFNQLDYAIGSEFNVVCLSFDEQENATIARAKKNEIIPQYTRRVGQEVSDHWAFLTGDAESVRRVAQAVGFRYKKLPNGEFAHPIAFMVLSPEGTVTRYFYGYDYPPRQMKLALLDASEGKVAQSIGDRVLHFCFQFDPTAGAYTIQALRVMQLGGVVTVVFLAGLVGGLLFRERRRRRRMAGQSQFETTPGSREPVSSWSGREQGNPRPAGH